MKTLWKSIISISLFFILLILLTDYAGGEQSKDLYLPLPHTPTISEDYIPSEADIYAYNIIQRPRIPAVMSNNITELRDVRQKCEKEIEYLNRIKDEYWDIYTHPLYEYYYTEIAYYDNLIARIQHQQLVEYYHNAYPVATEVWERLRAQGWSRACCAGIIGNMMAECGGHTLNLKPYTSGQGYYGLCQWSDKYCHIKGGSLVDQITYLINTIQYEFQIYGNGYSFQSFINEDSAADAAYIFAVVYERCASETYYQREVNAIKAYNTFLNY